METNIQQWGNSLGVRLPKDIAQKHSFGVGSRVRITDTKTGVVINLVPKKKASLSEMLKDVTDENMHTDVDWGESVGKEVW